MNVNLVFNKFRKRASLAGGLSYIIRSKENPGAFGTNYLKSLVTEGGATIGGLSGIAAGLALADAMDWDQGATDANQLKTDLALLLGSIGGYGLGGYATHKLTSNKSNKRKAKQEKTKR